MTHKVLRNSGTSGNSAKPDIRQKIGANWKFWEFWKLMKNGTFENFGRAFVVISNHTLIVKSIFEHMLKFIFKFIFEFIFKFILNLVFTFIFESIFEVTFNFIFKKLILKFIL